MANSYYQQFAELAEAFAALGQASADPDSLLVPMPAPRPPPSAGRVRRTPLDGGGLGTDP